MVNDVGQTSTTTAAQPKGWGGSRGGSGGPPPGGSRAAVGRQSHPLVAVLEVLAVKTCSVSAGPAEGEVCLPMPAPTQVA